MDFKSRTKYKKTLIFIVIWITVCLLHVDAAKLLGRHNVYTGGNTGTASIVVTVIEETSPEFIKPMESGGSTISISEDTASGSFVYQLSATDADGDTLTYVFTNDNSQFDLDASLVSQTALQVSTASTLDYETTQTFELIFEVRDGNSATATATLTVSITDVNDNAPVFGQASYTGSVLEKQTSATSVATVAATDADSSLNGNNVILYSITSGGTSLFSVDASSGVVSAQNLDYSVSPTHTITVTAKDRIGAIGALAATVAVTVTVETQPVWTEPDTDNKPYDVNEDVAADASIVLLAASDADSSGTLSYSIVSQTPTTPPDLFVLDTTTAGLLKRGTTNFNVDVSGAITSVTLSLRVTDGDYQSDRTIVINIKDVNDISPEFLSTSYTFAVSENAAVDTSVGSVTATDADLDSANNHITYSLSGTNSQHFKISSTIQGRIVVASSLVGASATYSLTVTASDGTNTATAPVTINVKTAPVWTAPASSGTSVNINEGSTTNVYLLQSTDTDGDTPVYTIVSQTPATPANMFVLDGTTNGQINVGSTELDVDASGSATSYTLVLKVSDGTNDVQSSVIFNIQDINDHDPQFDSATYTINVKESTAIGTSVGKITATDGDLTSAFNTISYTMQGTGSADFEVTSTGQINVKAALDNTTTSSYSLTITASDGARSGTATLTINVKTAPVWSTPASAVTVSKAEDVASTEVFYTILATDEDGDTLTYRIKTQTVANYFTLGGTNNRDVLMNTGNLLDYESAQQYSITFEVEDGTSDPVQSETVTITVTDVNDNAPVFSPATLSLTVKASSAVGDTIKTFTATDADSATNNNNVLSYAIKSGNTAGVFSLSGTGVLILAQTVTSGDSYTLVIEAQDGGTPVKSGQITVTLSTISDTDPVLTSPSSSVTISKDEDIAVGETVFVITASDADGDTILYTIKYQTPSSKFELVGNELKVKFALDYETETSYSLVFEIDDDDGNTANKVTSGTLTININNKNDNYPKFPKELYKVDVMEKQTEAIAVIKLTATDADAGVNGNIQYSIVGGDRMGQFTIDSTGQLSTTNIGLLRSKQTYHILAVQAKDAGSPALADSAHVVVNVLPLTDNGGSSTRINIVILLLCLVVVMLNL